MMIYLSPILLVLCASSFALASNQSWQREVNKRVKQLERRYDGYYKLLDERERREKKRKAGAVTLKKKRAAEYEKRKRARVQMRKDRLNRKVNKWEKPSVYNAYLKQKEKRENEHKANRSKFIQREEFIAKGVKKANKRLTDRQEYGMDL